MTKEEAEQLLSNTLKKLRDDGFSIYIDVKTGIGESESIGPYIDLSYINIKYN